ncbi:MULTISPECIES: response regulator transcription factor [Clostridia]|jgi:two-component system, OmpR family, response regulator VanR|uniref:response regulator transcription factor n=1 Tax=Clostridia TaxID=186801 RepID=UPI00051B7785|nr:MULTISPECIES: response regulator transcription factor [Clostridia]WOO37511.1 response regulator transcription factor [Anaerocolumna sp. AGMB13020]
MEAYRILVVEDDREILEGIGIYLKNQGYEVLKAENGREGLALAEKEKIHLAVVDVMMPGMDGITMTMKIREKYDFPIIMLTAKSEELDKLTGFQCGADDYVTKPFAPLELLARVNSHLRRYKKYLDILSDKEKEEEEENVYTVGGLELNENTVTLSVDGNPVKVTPLEFKILTLLMKNPGRVFSAEEIYEKVWNERAVNTDTIMVHIRNLREKIEYNPKEPKYLKVVWGVGYKIEKQQR